MPKQPRELSESGYYHVVTRGVGGMIIFEDDEDREQYLGLLKKYRDQLDCRVIAWVLMDNHVHMVLDFGEGNTPTGLMRRLDIPYAAYYRSKTGHRGHLFQDDYWSKPIKTEAQLVATVDYVHRNPERAHISSAESYLWSSAREYLGTSTLVDISTISELVGGRDKILSIVINEDDVVRESRRYSAKTRMTDEQVLATAIDEARVTSSSALRLLDKETRQSVIRRVSEHGATMRQIARVFGISANTVSRITRK